MQTLTGRDGAGRSPTTRGRWRWSDLSPAQRLAWVTLVAIQFGLATAAWTDLARRPAEKVRGPKWRWAAAIAVNFVGPLAWFRWGRRPATGVAVPTDGDRGARAGGPGGRR